MSINNVYTESAEVITNMITKIQKWGNSHGVTLSKQLMEATGLSVNDKVTMSSKGSRIIIEKAKPKLTLKEMFKGWDGTYPELDFSWEDVEPIGAERWWE